MSDWQEITADEAPTWLNWARKRNLLAPMPGWLREVVDAVLPDMQLPNPINLRVVFESDGARNQLWYAGLLHVWEQDGVGASGYAVPKPDVPVAERLVSFADWLQEQVFPETDGAWAQARPACPGHPHPAKPETTIDGEAWWVCPVTGNRIARIGTLRAAKRAIP